MRLGDLHVWVSVDDVELSEFAVEYSADEKEGSCWIPSECDKKFSVNWKHTNSSPRHTVNAMVSVDGIRCGSNDMICRDRKRPHIASGCRTSVATSAYTRRPLLFGRQELTDDDELLNAAISPEFGSIKVEVRHVREVHSHRSHRRPVWHGQDRSFETPVLHERSKKAIGHSVQFGAEFQAVNTKANQIEVVRELATFVFKYRPIELLRAQGIAPPLVRPAPAVSSAEVVDLTLDDDNEVEIKKLEAQLRALKKGTKVKSEPGVKQEKVLFKPGEVIDLT
ncbi:hypothetical protein MSAN_00314600 [Mycena sanguinolenta]|uniref:DUF7918 domain-containing protein n=1 Tax=Mycena sanguinolenta TaxID=230812 RepID=A0A8H6ZB22_9AGAR|nr:hypothetical protein MSAN_00314600 [Mycena sanguinolenta]